MPAWLTVALSALLTHPKGMLQGATATSNLLENEHREGRAESHLWPRASWIFWLSLSQASQTSHMQIQEKEEEMGGKHKWVTLGREEYWSPVYHCGIEVPGLLREDWM